MTSSRLGKTKNQRKIKQIKAKTQQTAPVSAENTRDFYNLHQVARAAQGASGLAQRQGLHPLIYRDIFLYLQRYIRIRGRRSSLLRKWERFNGQGTPRCFPVCFN